MAIADGDAACARAIELQLGGQLDAARQVYAQILQAEPRHPTANYGLGMLHVQARRPAEALPLLQVALQSDPAVADYWLGYLEALLLAGQLAAARKALQLGLQQGLAGAAAATQEFSTRLEAAEEEARLLALVAQRNNAAARELAVELIRRDPARSCAWNVLGTLLWSEGNNADAEQVLTEAVRLSPRDAEAHCNLGLVLMAQERFAAAEMQLRLATQLAPDSAHVHYSLGLALAQQAKVVAGEASFRHGLELRAQAPLAGEDATSYSNLLFCMAHNPELTPEEFFAEHRRFGERAARQARPAGSRAAGARDPGRRLNVGFVSGDFSGHPVGQFLEPVVTRLAARGDLNLHAYSTHPAADATTARLRPAFRGWTDVDLLADADLAARIGGDRIDILVDLTGHTWFNRLPMFACRPAPVQVSWLGYPGTTGLAAMDYYLADECWLPPGAFADQFTEKLVYLPQRWGYQLHTEAAAVEPLPALQSGRLVFGSFHRFGKLNDATIRLWADILRAVPGAILLLVAVPLTGCDQQLRDRFAALGGRAGATGFPSTPVDGGVFQPAWPGGHRPRHAGLCGRHDDHALACDGGTDPDGRGRHAAGAGRGGDPRRCGPGSVRGGGRCGLRRAGAGLVAPPAGTRGDPCRVAPAAAAIAGGSAGPDRSTCGAGAAAHVAALVRRRKCGVLRHCDPDVRPHRP